MPSLDSQPKGPEICRALARTHQTLTGRRTRDSDRFVLRYKRHDRASRASRASRGETAGLLQYPHREHQVGLVLQNPEGRTTRDRFAYV